MIRGAVIFFTLSFFILSSCQENQSITHIQFPDDSRTLVFFTDESNLQDESTYYDAIIDLKNSFPDEVANLKVVHSENEKLLYKQFNVKATPSLIVVHDNEVVTQIEGSKPKKDIVVSIEQALNQAGNSTY
ncbi:hypothetical protein B4U37_09085 [Sutcliffiella horikoshii]|uniref:Small peptidoglycan-associated lipoprotein n=1 Tax=Sutcliffiella horikoshii TaxID=79883 RepID=A0ABN4ZIW3_9BACI|nr:hypothetical protein [Sutcliffiella horikoshii]ART76184.1 hypothetical protein B4U37_09085 [Sutcliffiella horikoshii]UAL49010.1 hypothetical protein K7887_08780 [Sutcliffiella horikoshii]